MTWIKTNFLWMMYRCDWGTKDKNQTRILAIWLKRPYFEEILSHAVHSGYKEEVYGTKKGYNTAVSHAKQNDFGFVRLQWDPDHSPSGSPHPHRRAIQLGLKSVKCFIEGEAITEIKDITQFVAAQREFRDAEHHHLLMVPRERLYHISSQPLVCLLLIGDNPGFEEKEGHEDLTSLDSQEQTTTSTTATTTSTTTATTTETTTATTASTTSTTTATTTATTTETTTATTTATTTTNHQ